MYMELKEIKCKNCGAKLKIEENEKIATCDFCGAKFSVEDEYSKAYHATKGAFDAQMDSFKELTSKMPGFKYTRIFITIFSVVMLGIIITLSVSSFMSFNKTSKRISSDSTTNEAYSKQVKQIEIQSFNGAIELANGKSAELLISKTLDDIIVSNKKNKDHKIVVKYKDISTNEEDGIVEIRDSLKENKQYNVSLDYDSEGYINVFTITDIK